MKNKIVVYLSFLLIFSYFFSCTQPDTVSPSGTDTPVEAKKTKVSIVVRNADEFKNCSFEIKVSADGTEVDSISTIEDIITGNYTFEKLSVVVNCYDASNNLIATGELKNTKNLIIIITLVKIDTEPVVPLKPVMSPEAGVYNRDLFAGVTITADATADAVYYTIDDTNPDSSKTLYTGTIALTQTTTVKAVSFRNGVYSVIAQSLYELTDDSVVSPVQFSIEAGTYPLETFQGIVLTSDTKDAEIRYTLDGSIPDSSSILYTKAILFDTANTYIVKAIAFKNGSTASSVSSGEYVIEDSQQPIVANPIVFPAAGTYTNTSFSGVTLTTDEAGSQIYYTIDGSNPDKTKTLYSKQIVFSETTTIKAVVYKDGVYSAVVTALYTLTKELVVSPVQFSIADGTYLLEGFKALTLATTTENSEIRYTIDGSVPSATSLLYTTALPYTKAGTYEIKAIALKSGFITSTVTAVKFTIEIPLLPVLEKPIVTPAEGTYKINDFPGVTIQPEANVQFRYTVDGSEPTESSPLYTAKIELKTAGVYTVKIKNFRSGYTSYVTVTKVYTIINNDIPTVKTPVVSPANGTYTISDFLGFTVTPDTGVTFRYTLDGSEPTETSAVYTEKLLFSVKGSYTVKTKGFKAECLASETVTRLYTIIDDVIIVTPAQIDPASGTYYIDQFSSIVITTKHAGGETYYTLDGVDPTKASLKYTASVTLGVGTHTVKAITYVNDSSSLVTIKEYIVKERLSGKVVYFKDDGTWPVRKIYYYDDSTTPANKVAEWVSMPSMTDAGNGWFTYHMSEDWVANTTKIIFYGGDNSKRYPADAQPGIDVCSWSEGYYLLSTKEWTEVNPDGLVVSAVPGDSTFKTEATVLLKATGGTIVASRYTTDGSDPKLAGTTFDPNGQTITFGGSAVENDKVYLKVYASDSTKEVNSTFTYTKKNQAVDLIVHFEKPDSWSKAYIHYWDVTTPTTWLTCPEVPYESGKWYKYTFTGEDSAKFLFKNASGEPGDRIADQFRDKEGWFANRNGEWKWFDSNPDNGVPAIITSNPQGGYFSSATVNVTLGMTIDPNTTLVEAKYTTNGSDPKTSGTPFSNGTLITVGSGLTDGQSAKVRVYVAVKSKVNEILISERDYTYTKGTAPTVNMLGATHSASSTTFSIWSPDTSDVKVTVDGTDHACLKLTDSNGYTDVYGVTLTGDLHLKEYKFKINGKGVRDPYGVMINNTTGNNVVIDLTKTEPAGGWATRPAFANREDAVVYEVHVRDFTIDSTSGVSASKKGKFMGMVETGTTNGSVKTGIDHLKELGVTHVQLLPFYDFSTGMYNWGYDPVNYNIPEEQYSMTPGDHANRVKEVKEMINEYHKNGIRVVMDVVYNHTFANEMFADITGKYFTGNNDSGCGNGINTGVPMVSRFIRDSLEYWAKEYNIDGFRFDLIGIFHYDEVRKWGEYLNVEKYADRNLLMYGEPWNGYWLSDPIENQKVRLGTTAPMASGHVGVFNGKYREDIKGDNDKKGKNYMFNQETSWFGAIAAGMRGSIKAAKNMNVSSSLWEPMFAYDPEQSINYISAHDNLCLWDKIIYSDTTGGATGYAGRVAKFGMGIVLTSQGIPFIHAGDEMLRTKAPDGDWEFAHNSYNAPDKYNQIRWNWKSENAAIFNYHRDLIALRKAHPGLRLTSWDEINTRMRTEINNASASGINCVNNASLPAKVVLSLLDEDNNVGNGYELAVMYNPGDNYTWTLPSGTWKKVFDANGACNVSVSGSAVVEGSSVTVFAKD